MAQTNKGPERIEREERAGKRKPGRPITHQQHVFGDVRFEFFIDHHDDDAALIEATPTRSAAHLNVFTRSQLKNGRSNNEERKRKE